MDDAVGRVIDRVIEKRKEQLEAKRLILHERLTQIADPHAADVQRIVSNFDEVYADPLTKALQQFKAAALADVAISHAVVPGNPSDSLARQALLTLTTQGPTEQEQRLEALRLKVEDLVGRLAARRVDRELAQQQAEKRRLKQEISTALPALDTRVHAAKIEHEEALGHWKTNATNKKPEGRQRRWEAILANLRSKGVDLAAITTAPVVTPRVGRQKEEEALPAEPSRNPASNDRGLSQHHQGVTAEIQHLTKLAHGSEPAKETTIMTALPPETKTKQYRGHKIVVREKQQKDAAAATLLKFF